MAMSIGGSLENNLTNLKQYMDNINMYGSNIEQLEEVHKVRILNNDQFLILTDPFSGYARGIYL